VQAQQLNTVVSNLDLPTANAMHALMSTAGAFEGIAAIRDEPEPGAEWHSNCDEDLEWKDMFYQGLDAYPDEEVRPVSESRIFFRAPREMLNERSMFYTEPPRASKAPEPSTTELVDFFNVSHIPRPEEGPDHTYQSMRATLLLEDADAKTAPVNAVVDSGAAYCGIRKKFAMQAVPGLMDLLQPSHVRFRDAQGHRMGLAGKIMLPIWLGERRLLAPTYVFEELGTDFLLGANAIAKNGLIIDGNERKLYAPGETPSKGIDLRVHFADAAPPEHKCCTDGECSCPRAVNGTIVCDVDGCKLITTSPDGEAHVNCTMSETPPNAPWIPGHAVEARLLYSHSLGPGDTLKIELSLLGVVKGRLEPVQLELTEELRAVGFVSHDAVLHNG